MNKLFLLALAVAVVALATPAYCADAGDDDVQVNTTDASDRVVTTTTEVPDLKYNVGKGTKGEKGGDGAKGAKGGDMIDGGDRVNGNKGAKGAKGGENGAKGAKGGKGEKGAKGGKGKKGGKTFVVGHMPGFKTGGEAAAPGAKGVKGAKGAVGEAAQKAGKGAKGGKYSASSTEATSFGAHNIGLIAGGCVLVAGLAGYVTIQARQQRKEFTVALDEHTPLMVV